MRSHHLLVQRCPNARRITQAHPIDIYVLESEIIRRRIGPKMKIGVPGSPNSGSAVTMERTTFEYKGVARFGSINDIPLYFCIKETIHLERYHPRLVVGDRGLVMILFVISLIP